MKKPRPFLRLLPRPSSQPPAAEEGSVFFKLPLELRDEVYTYIFASSLIYEPTKEPLSDWDNLLLTCHRVKFEMESLPARPIISLVEVNWLDHFQGHPLKISQSVKESRQNVQKPRESRLKVAIPHAVFQKEYLDLQNKVIPEFISPLFRIFTDTLKITFYDDGYPMPIESGDLVLGAPYWQIIALIWGREPRYLWLHKKFHDQKFSARPCRNFFNFKQLIVKFPEGHRTYYGVTMKERAAVWTNRNSCRVLFWCARLRIKAGFYKKMSKRTKCGHRWLYEFRVESESRFRI